MGQVLFLVELQGEHMSMRNVYHPLLLCFRAEVLKYVAQFKHVAMT